MELGDFEERVKDVLVLHVAWSDEKVLVEDSPCNMDSVNHVLCLRDSLQGLDAPSKELQDVMRVDKSGYLDDPTLFRYAEIRKTKWPEPQDLQPCVQPNHQAA